MITILLIALILMQSAPLIGTVTETQPSDYSCQYPTPGVPACFGISGFYAGWHFSRQLWQRPESWSNFKEGLCQCGHLLPSLAAAAIIDVEALTQLSPEEFNNHNGVSDNKMLFALVSGFFIGTTSRFVHGLIRYKYRQAQELVLERYAALRDLAPAMPPPIAPEPAAPHLERITARRHSR